MRPSFFLHTTFCLSVCLLLVCQIDLLMEKWGRSDPPKSSAPTPPPLSAHSYLAHSSLLFHTEQAGYPGPRRSMEKRGRLLWASQELPQDQPLDTPHPKALEHKQRASGGDWALLTVQLPLSEILMLVVTCHSIFVEMCLSSKRHLRGFLEAG